MNENGYCPHCKSDLDGEDIVKTFLDRGLDLQEAKDTAELYGYQEGHTKFCRAIGIYDMMRDRTIAYRCPDCGKEWNII